MLKDKKKYEEKVLKLFKKLLEKKDKEFLKKNITHTNPELFILKGNNNDYTSEVRTYFYQREELIDVIEFFTFYNGQTEATISEFETWFIEELDNIGLGWKEMKGINYESRN